MIKKKYLAKIPLALIAFSSGCQYDPRAYEYATSRPTQSIVGDYFLAAETVTFLKDKHYPPKASHINLRSDSTFVINDIADLWNDFEESTRSFESAKGRWSIGKHQKWWALKLNVDSIREYNSYKYRAGFRASAMLIGNQQPYILNFTIGDPDAGEALRFRQKTAH